jgi:hypothetical protein
VKKFGFPAAIGMAALSTTLLACRSFVPALPQADEPGLQRIAASHHGEGYYSHGGAPQITARHRRED